MHQVYRIVPRENQCFGDILEDLQIPLARIDFYINCLQDGKYLLVINNTEPQVKQVESMFNYLGIQDWEIYYSPKVYHLISSSFDKVSLSQNAVDRFMLSSLNSLEGVFSFKDKSLTGQGTTT